MVIKLLIKGRKQINLETMMHKVTFTLLIVGGLNWLLEAFGWGIGQYLGATGAQIVYVVIGLSAVYELVMHKKMCRMCNPGGQA